MVTTLVIAVAAGGTCWPLRKGGDGSVRSNADNDSANNSTDNSANNNINTNYKNINDSHSHNHNPQQQRNSNNEKLPPHAYKTADDAYRAMKRGLENRLIMSSAGRRNIHGTG
eukprot:272209_1